MHIEVYAYENANDSCLKHSYLIFAIINIFLQLKSFPHFILKYLNNKNQLV